MEDPNLPSKPNPENQPSVNPPVPSNSNLTDSVPPNNNGFNPNQLHSVLGITSLILGILGLVVSLIPCIGAFSGPVSFLGIISGGIGTFLARKQKASTNMAVIGLVLSILALIFAARQAYFFSH